MNSIPLRQDVAPALTWDLTALCCDSADFKRQLQDCQAQAVTLKNNYLGKLNDAENLIAAITAYATLLVQLDNLANYAHMALDVDMANGENLNNSALFQTVSAEILSQLSFIESEAKAVDGAILATVKKNATCKGFVDDIIRNKPHMLGAEAEMVLKALSGNFRMPFNIYNQAKLVDLAYPELEIGAKRLPFDFVAFENSYDGIADSATRHKAFALFSEYLAKYQNTIATALNAQMQLEKTTATLRGFDSVFDYLLFEQKVTRAMYDRQIDRIVEALAPAMRKYAKLLQDIHGLSKMTFADLKMAVDPEYEKKLTVEESKDYILGALAVYGEEYQNLLRRAYDERWIDFAFNQNKSSGAYCATPYGNHPYVLLSWSGSMEDVFTLAHELGHAVQGHYSNKHQSCFENDPSLYLIEAPSTINELLMADYLLNQNPDDVRFKRWVISNMIGKTYYHNFVTHLLEAHFQRECYKIVDAGGSLSAADFNRLKLETLKKFWGDSVEMIAGAELTWMRQPHYYMGLYPYTYSAGLTIATAVNQLRLNEGDAAIKNWQEVLKLGGSVTPLQFAQRAGVDISTDQPLMTTIAYISDQIEQMIALTAQLKKTSQ